MSVRAHPAATIPEWMVGGFAPTIDRVDIAVDPAIADEDLRTYLPYLVAHELHHVARRRGPGYGRTLRDAIVTEGLADHFALELLGGSPPPWSVALTRADLTALTALAAKDNSGSGYDHQGWFFGRPPQIPRWTGYAIGFEVVGDFIERNQMTASQLTDTPTDQIWAP